MEKELSIELRSAKVREIVGQVPPKLVRLGIVIISVILFNLFVMAYFIKFDYYYTTKAVVYQNKIDIHIPSNQFRSIKIGAKCIVDQNVDVNVLNDIRDCRVESINDILLVDENGYYYLATSNINITNVEIREPLIINVKLKGKRQSIFNYVFN